MNKLSLCLCLALLVMLLGACATTPDREQIERDVQATFNPFDADYVETVNRTANRLGTRVIWVNPPRRSDRDE
jgi:starvation-inducible outer membrane lipoprotein